MATNFYLIFLLLPLVCFSQRNSNLFYGENNSALPIVIDDLTLDNLETYPLLEYDSIKQYLVSHDNEFKIGLTNVKGDKFFKLAHYYIENTPILILAHEFKNGIEERSLVYMLIYNNEHQLLSFDIIAQKSKKGALTSEKIGLIDSNFILNLKFHNHKESSDTSYYRYNNKKIFPFDSYDCKEISECTDFSPTIHHLPNKSIKEYIFDKDFFESQKKLIPLKYISPDTFSQILSSIDGDKKVSMNNYFVDSKKIEDGRIIIFFLNEYKYENYEQVSEIGYQIFNKNGKLSKKDNIALYHRDRDNVVLILDGEIKIHDNVLEIKTKIDGNNDQIMKFKLDTDAN